MLLELEKVDLRISTFIQIKNPLSNNDHDLTIQPIVKYEIRMLQQGCIRNSALYPKRFAHSQSKFSFLPLRDLTYASTKCYVS